MTKDLWTKVDQYVSEVFLPDDPVLAAALQASSAAGLPPINVSPPQGKLLHILAMACGARRILEIGTLGGYSTIWLARALPPGGQLTTLEVDAKHAEIALANFRRGGLDSIIELKLGKASDTLLQLVDRKVPPYDLIFIDADKEGYPDYLNWSLRLSRPGTLIIADNVVRDGAVADPSSSDPRVQAVRRFNEMLAANTRLSSIVLQTVGSKGYDGFAVALVLS